MQLENGGNNLVIFFQGSKFYLLPNSSNTEMFINAILNDYFLKACEILQSWENKLKMPDSLLAYYILKETNLKR